jgi:hypothetical protein
MTLQGSIAPTGAEDAIGRHVDVELLFHSRLDVDLGQNAKTVIRQRLSRPSVDVVDTCVGDHAIDCVGHREILSPISEDI